MDKLFIIFAAVLGFVALAVALSALFALPVMWLWNGLCTELFHLPTITFMQAWGLQILCGFLFKSSSSGTGKSS